MDLFGVSYFIKPGSTLRGGWATLGNTHGKDIALSCGERHPDIMLYKQKGVASDYFGRSSV
jgi:hypothetical protein